MKCIPIIPSLKGAGFYVTHRVLIHLRNVYVLTACQPSTRFWGGGRNHLHADPVALLGGLVKITYVKDLA